MASRRDEQSSVSKRQLENVPAERAVLGSIIADPQIYWELNGSFQPNVFTLPIHRDISKAMIELAKGGRDIVMPAILSKLPPPPSDRPVSREGQLATLISDRVDAIQAKGLFGDLIEMTTRRMMMEAGKRMIEQSSQDDGRGASEVFESILTEVRSNMIGTGADSMSLFDGIMVALNIATERAKGLRPSGLTWPMEELDRIMGLMEPGHLIGVLADAKAGKTSFGLQVARHMARSGRVDVFSMEMRHDEVGVRILSQESRVPEDVIAEGRYTDAQWDAVSEAMARLQHVPIHTIDKSRMTVSQIRSTAMEHKRRYGLVGLVMDHLKLIRPEGKQSSLVDRYEQIMTDLKAMAKDLDVPCILLMQRTRDSFKRPNPRPKADDAFGGGATVENCNSMLAIWRKEKWLEQNRPSKEERVGHGRDSEPAIDVWMRELEHCRGRAELINLARRRGKPDQSFECQFIGEYGLYEMDRHQGQASLVPGGFDYVD